MADGVKNAQGKRWTHLESRAETHNRISSWTWSKQWSSQHFIVKDKKTERNSSEHPEYCAKHGEYIGRVLTGVRKR